MTLKYKGLTNPDPVEKVLPIGEPLLEITGPIREGATKVTGKADALLSKVVIMAYSGWRTGPSLKTESSTNILQAKKSAAAKVRNGALQCEDSELEESMEVPVADGVFTAILDRSLAAGACVQAQPIFAVAPPADTETPVTIYSEPLLVRPVLEEWARLRGYFSLGSTIDHYNEQFNRQDYFVGWTSDALVWGRIVEKSCPKVDGKPTKGCPDSQFRTSFLRDRRIQLNVFSEARVRVALATGDATTTANTTPGATVTVTRLLPPDFKAAQSGFFQIGIHTPMSWKGMDFVNRGQQFSFYVSPIAKIGGEALDRDLVTYQLKQNFSSTNTNGTVHREEVRRGVLPFYSYGARFGLFQYEFFGAQHEAKNRQVTNDPIAYIDFTWGKAHAFRSYDFAYTRLVPADPRFPEEKLREVIFYPPNQQQIETSNLVRTEMSSSVRKRFAIEGRMKLFSLPALIGVDFNVRTNARDWEPNQLRFVLAFRIDAQRALGRIFPSSFQKEKK